ncbi:MAG TPA: AMP-binding protein [Pelomicrobium sp.]|nr:AMP-binding protein [Pelomicrobium sp.]
MPEYFDALETRDPQAREEALIAALSAQVDHAKRVAPACRRLLADVGGGDIRSRADLARLPLTRKARLTELQQAEPPFGGLVSTEPGAIGRVFASPGPIFDLEGHGTDWWRFARALFAAGFRRGDLVHNTFSYHFTPAGFMVDGGARALGCRVFPAGVGQTELQVQAIAALRPDGYGGTPSFLKILCEKADEMGADISSLGKALVSGEALPASLRNVLRERGVVTRQCYASADLGLIAYESTAQEGLIVDEGVVVEIVRPGTGDPVADGEVGEVVVTALNPDYPLIRFATGDLSAVLPGASPCGRTNMRIRGWMGRADQTAKVRGMFVHPGQVAEIARRHPEVKRARLVIEFDDARNDRMVLRCETSAAGGPLAQALEGSIRDVTRLRAEVEFVPPGTLPNDGKAIEDARPVD